VNIAQTGVTRLRVCSAAFLRGRNAKVQALLVDDRTFVQHEKWKKELSAEAYPPLARFLVGTGAGVRLIQRGTDLLAKLQEQMDLSYLFIAHDLSVVEHISDRVAVMYLGRIVELATDKELYQNPLHPYSRALLSAVPIPDPEIRRKKILLQGDVPSPMSPPSGCRFHTRCSACKEICSQQEPAFHDAGGGHWVACHLA